MKTMMSRIYTQILKYNYPLYQEKNNLLKNKIIKGSKHLEEAKRRMSEIKKGKYYSPKTEFKKGHKLNLGRRHSENWRKNKQSKKEETAL